MHPYSLSYVVGAVQEVAICFGGRLMRGNRAQKVDSSVYQAFDSPTYPPLASLGVDVDWNKRFLLQVSLSGPHIVSSLPLAL